MQFFGFINAAFLILIVTTSFETLLMADPRTDIAGLLCRPTGVYTLKYRENYVSTMTNLNDLVNQKGFGTTVVGEGADAIYALAQCYKDLNSSECTLCFSRIRSLLPTCHRAGRGGRLFLDGCFGRNENFSFFDQSIDDLSVTNCSYIKNNTEPGNFRETVTSVVENVSSKASKSNGFAVESLSAGSNLSVYALAQCWESLDEKACNSCLQAASSSLVSCSPAVEGRALNAGCYMRYSIDNFLNSIPESDNSVGKRRRILIILFSTIIGSVLLTGLYLWKAKQWLITLYRRFSKDSRGNGLSSVISQWKLFKYQDLKRATNGFDSSNKLGQGSYGAVYKGVLSDGTKVATKRLFLNIKQYIDQFMNEVELVNRVQHKNLVKLLGCSVDGPQVLLVFEYCVNKSLDRFLFDKKEAKGLDWKKRFDIVEGVAEGLSYLHRESEIRIIHRDIKASNILLNEKFKPKITDFGLARSFAEDLTHLSTGIAGTLGYMAPEYAMHGHLTEKADVYSFGVLTLEVVTGQRCTSGLETKSGQSLLAKIWSNYKAKTMEQMIDKSIYEETLKPEILRVVRVALLCTQATASYRPTMAKVVELLRSQRDQGEVFPIDPPFLDFSAVDDNREQSEDFHAISHDAARSSSGSSGSLLYGR